MTLFLRLLLGIIGAGYYLVERYHEDGVLDPLEVFVTIIIGCIFGPIIFLAVLPMLMSNVIIALNGFILYLINRFKGYE